MLASKGKKGFLASLSQKLKATAKAKNKGKGKMKGKGKGQEEEEAGKEGKEKAFAKGAGFEQALAIDDKVYPVVEDPSVCLCLGAFAKVTKIDPNNVIQVTFEDYTSFGLAPHSLKADLFEVRGELKANLELKSLVRQPRHLKLSLLQGGGVENPEWDALTPLGSIKDQASEDHIDLYAACVEWSIGLGEQTRIKFVPARLSRKLVQDARLEPELVAVDLAEPIVEERVRAKRVELFRRFFEHFEELVIPVHAPARPGSCQHWTLLSVRKTEGGLIVSYFETLDSLHKLALEGAHILLRLLDVDPKLLQWQAQTVKQKGVECGWMVCHFLEELLRRAAGMYKQSQGWPNLSRLSKIVQYIKRMVDSLENVRLKWAADLAKERKKDEDFEANLREKSAAFLKRTEILERIVQVHRDLAKLELQAGAAEEVPLDEAFLLRFEEHQKKLREQREAAKQAKLEAQAMLEAVQQELEAAPAVEKAAQEEDLPPLPPPAEEPVEEAPAVEKAPTKAEVKQVHKNIVDSKDVDLFELCLRTARVEDLGEEQQAFYRKVEERGIGVCSRCRWSYGCLSCDKVKAWAYVVRWQLGHRRCDVVEPAATAPKAKGGGGLSEVVLVIRKPPANSGK